MCGRHRVGGAGGAPAEVARSMGARCTRPRRRWGRAIVGHPPPLHAAVGGSARVLPATDQIVGLLRCRQRLDELRGVWWGRACAWDIQLSAKVSFLHVTGCARRDCELSAFSGASGDFITAGKGGLLGHGVGSAARALPCPSEPLRERDPTYPASARLTGSRFRGGGGYLKFWAHVVA